MLALLSISTFFYLIIFAMASILIPYAIGNWILRRFVGSTKKTYRSIRH